MTEDKELTIVQRLALLLKVKSLVTVILTGVFAYLSVAGIINAEQFMNVFLIIMAFYFGVQTTKGKE